VNGVHERRPVVDSSTLVHVGAGFDQIVDARGVPTRAAAMRGEMGGPDWQAAVRTKRTTVASFMKSAYDKNLHVKYFTGSHQFRHRLGLKQLAARFGDPAGQAVGLFLRALSWRCGFGVHLAIEFGDQHERNASFQGFDAIGAGPDGGRL